MSNKTPDSNLSTYYIYNPDTEDFEIKYDIHENSNPVTYIIPFRQMKQLPLPVAELAKKKLAEKLAFKRGWQGSNYEDTYNAILKEIEVNL